MEHMPDFRLLRPASIAEAVAAAHAHPEARMLAGGTDLLPNIRRGIASPGVLIDVSGVAGLSGISHEGDGLRIGAAVALAELEENPMIRTTYPAIAEAAGCVAATSHRQVATVGGNLCLDTRCVYYNQSEWWRRSNEYCFKSRGDVCHVAPKTVACFASFSGDLAPALIVYAAEIEIASAADGSRVIPLTDLYREDGRNHLRLAPGELVVAVRVPPATDWRSGYSKARVRSAIDFPLAGVAAAIATNGADLTALRISLTGTNSRPILVDGTDAFVGSPLDEGALDAIAQRVPKQIQPMPTTFTPPGYRRRVVANMTRALLRRLFRT